MTRCSQRNVSAAGWTVCHRSKQPGSSCWTDRDCTFRSNRRAPACVHRIRVGSGSRPPHVSSCTGDPARMELPTRYPSRRHWPSRSVARARERRLPCSTTRSISAGSTARTYEPSSLRSPRSMRCCRLFSTAVPRRVQRASPDCCCEASAALWRYRSGSTASAASTSSLTGGSSSNATVVHTTAAGRLNSATDDATFSSLSGGMPFSALRRTSSSPTRRDRGWALAASVSRGAADRYGRTRPRASSPRRMPHARHSSPTHDRARRGRRSARARARAPARTR